MFINPEKSAHEPRGDKSPVSLFIKTACSQQLLKKLLAHFLAAFDSLDDKKFKHSGMVAIFPRCQTSLLFQEPTGQENHGIFYDPPENISPGGNKKPNT